MKDKIAIIGLGYVGLPLAVEFAKKYYTVGFDINAKRIEELNQGHDATLEVEDDALKSVLIKPEGSLGLVTPFAKVILLGAIGGYCRMTSKTVIKNSVWSSGQSKSPAIVCGAFVFNSTDIYCTSFTRSSKSSTPR